MGSPTVAEDSAHTLLNASVEPIQREAEGGVQTESAAGTFAQATSSGGGQVPHLQKMNDAFGQDFSNVDAHTGASNEMGALGANAAAQGETVAFASPSPSVKTVAHELTHVMQHRNQSGGDSVHGEGEVSSASSPAEKEATSVANQVAAGQSVMVTGTPGEGIHLDPEGAEEAPTAVVEEGTPGPENVDTKDMTAGKAAAIGGKLGASAKFLENTKKSVDMADEGSFSSLSSAAATEADGASSLGSFMGVLKEAAGPLAAAYGVYSSYTNMQGKDKAKGSFEKAIKTAESTVPPDSEMKEIATYGFNKIRRAFGSALKKLMEAILGFMGAVAALVPGGQIAGGVMALAKGISSGAESFGRSTKGVWKWLMGTKGKARDENASKLYNRVAKGDAQASELLVGAMDEDVLTGGGMANAIASTVGMAAPKISDLEGEDTTAKAKSLVKSVMDIEEKAGAGDEKAVGKKTFLVNSIANLMKSK